VAADHVDTPFHRYADGEAIGAEAFAGLDVRGRAVLVQTGWDRHWGTDAYLSGEHPFLTSAAAEALRDGGAALVGIDGLNIDALTDMGRPVHTVLLGAGIPIVEHMTGLAAVPDGARFYAVPPPIEGMGTFPVRAFAVSV
jgi:arylformamidase